MADQLSITPEQLDALGQIADSCDNYAGAAKLPLPPAMHAEQLKIGMERLSERIKQLHYDISGENPWEAGPGAFRPIDRS